jgi:hypothetical protein
VAAVVRKRDLNRDGKLNLIELSLDLDGNGDLGPAEILQVIVREDAKAEAPTKSSGDPGGTSGK